ncbi:multicopper oxidase family protein [Streptomyces sp. HUCO-GS316]|uniref:multicopper oxidase family protein n=1 Tax=Streptomyces sp. HUCO-GS316 TaxID=2692198 RepID=UPI00301DDA6F
MLHTRRQLLTVAGTAVAAAAIPPGLVAARERSTGPARNPSARTAPDAPFRVPLELPRPLEPQRFATYDYYELTTAETDARLLPGTPTRVRAFNGEFAPVLLARRDRPTLIRQRNRLSTAFAMHLHGGHVPADSDGHPRHQVEPGEERLYHYPNRQRAATLWLHDHTHHDHAESVYRGLAAAYLLTDDVEDALTLPKGRYDVTLQLRDAEFAADGSLVYDPKGIQRRSVYLVNGRPRPYFEVAARAYRLRLLNTSNDRFFRLRLHSGDELTLIGSDGGLLPSPVPTAEVPLWPAERQEVVIDFSRYPVGTRLVLENAAALPGEAPEVLRFDVVRAADGPSSVPARLREAPDPGEAVRERRLSLKSDPASGTMLINDRPFDMDRVDLRPVRGETEIWRIVNDDVDLKIPHSLHLHLEHFTVVDRDGAPPGPAESGLKDTITVLPGQSVRVKVHFSDYTGLFMYHCHMLQHQMMGMMGQMEVVP